MPSFSRQSEERLETCDERLQDVFNRVIEDFDCSILDGHRSKIRQMELYEAGKTQVLESEHNVWPSRAVDVAPYPIDWEDRERFHLFAGYVMGVAEMMGVPLRWGGDWDGDKQVSDNDFDDLVHFELDE